MSYTDSLGSAKPVGHGTGAPRVETPQNEILKSQLTDSPPHPPLPHDHGSPKVTTPLSSRTVESGPPGNSGVEEPYIRLPSLSREELSALIKSGDKPIEYLGNTFRPSDLDRLQQSMLQQQWDTGLSGMEGREVELRGDDRLIIIRRHDGEFAEVTLREAAGYAKAIEKSHPELAELLRNSLSDIRRTDAPQIFREVPGSGPVIYDRKAFYSECQHLTIGTGASGQPLSKREELARGWALFQNALSAKPQFDQSGLLVFGRTRDVNHTGAFSLGYTSEYDNGAVLMPEDWTLFMNNCWVMGGIKGGCSFGSLTEFVHGPRESKEKGKVEDFRNDFSDLEKSPPQHYVIVVSAAEITALKEFGYKAVDHPTFGTMMVPDPSPEGQMRRETATFTELQTYISRLMVGQSVENLTGSDRIGPELMAFIRQDPKSDGESLVKLKALLTDIQKSGIAANAPENAVARREMKIGAALERIETLEKQMKSGTKVPAAAIESAWQEVRNCMLYIADKALEQRGITGPAKDTIKLALVIWAEVQRTFSGAPGFGLTTLSSVNAFIDSFVDTVRPSQEPKDPTMSALVEQSRYMHNLLGSFHSRFEDIARMTGRGDEAPALWDNFQVAMARVSVMQATIVDLPMNGDSLEGHAKAFLSRFDYIPNPRDGMTGTAKL